MNGNARPPGLSRRELLRLAGLVGGAWAGVQLTGCTDDDTTRPTPGVSLVSSASSATAGASNDTGTGATAPAAASGGATVLLAYFSRAGENYFYGDRTFLDVGNTHVVAELIRALIPVDMYRIEAADPYSDSYDETVARNVREQTADARPTIANPIPAVDGYDTVLLGSGIWNVRPPMIMSTFLDGVDLAGKRLVPFVTYAVSGLGRTIDVYSDLAPAATIGEGLAVRGEEAATAGDDVADWLRRLDLLPS